MRKKLQPFLDINSMWFQKRYFGNDKSWGKDCLWNFFFGRRFFIFAGHGGKNRVNRIEYNCSDNKTDASCKDILSKKLHCGCIRCINLGLLYGKCGKIICIKHINTGNTSKNSGRNSRRSNPVNWISDTLEVAYKKHKNKKSRNA